MKAFFLLLAVFFSAVPCLAAPSLIDPSLKVEVVVSGLSLPTTMAFIGDNDILVLQKNDGRVRRVIGGVLQSGEVLDVAVDSSSEHGLLGIALHPDFATNHLGYLYYTESSTVDDDGGAAANRVYQYTWDATTGTLTNAVLILDLPVTPGPNHDGGIIAFGPDDKLYVIIGDLNRNGQLQNFTDIGAPAPDDTSVILRLNDNGTSLTDNPFSSDPNNILSRYYAYGVRNSFGMGFDPVTGNLWDTENGEGTFDEINLVARGFNSGWEEVMGPLSRDPEGNDESDLVSFAGSHYADPKFSWFDTVGPTAIIFLDSTELGNQYQNDVFVGDINNGNLYHFQPNAARDGFVLSGGLSDLVVDNGTELNQVILGTGFSGITDLKVGPDGLLYVVSIGDGAIYRISLTAAPPFFNASFLPDAEVGVDYSADLGIGGGTAPYTVTVIKGSLPNGLMADSDGISGIPSSTKKSVFSLRVTDQMGALATKQFRIKVFKALNISTQTLRKGRVGRSFNTTLIASRGKKPYAWSLISGDLPAGLALGPGSGRITGTPSGAESQTFTVEVSDPLGGSKQKSFTLTIDP